MLRHSELVYVKKVPGKGRGVFARQAIEKGAVIERVPTLSRFCFIRNETTLAIALGYGSLYNHSYKPNARYDDEPAAQMIFTAIRNIAPDEEITINYNGAPWRKADVGFEVV